MERRTRIVATLGPASDRPGVLAAMLSAGVDVVRINFSHGTGDEHLTRIARLREAASGVARPIAVLGDLPGPKLRVRIPQAIALVPGQAVTFAVRPGASAMITATEPELLAEVQPSQRILLDDGRIHLRAVAREGDTLIARVEVPGKLLPGKGINLPDTTFTGPALTARDHQAIAVAAQAGVDWLALSFVRAPEAAAELRNAASALGLRVPVLAKIERPEAVQLAPAIIAAFDGIMVARGDLGVEIPLEQVPHVQKQLIQQAREAGKPVITATEMLESMRSNPRPTRAEASDVANAIYDGTDAIMLSGETAVGEYPVEAVAAMDRIARETEPYLAHDADDVLTPRAGVAEQIAQGACALAQVVDAKAIVAPTLSGQTAKLVARHRPRARIVAPATSEEVRRQLALYWGIIPLYLPAPKSPGEDLLESGVRAAFGHGALAVGDLVVVLAGHPIAGGEHVPTLRVVRIGEGGASGEP